MGKKDNTLVKNASFLMVAALVSKIIGLLYKSPLSDMLDSEGFGYFQFAQNAYFILLMIASFSIPQAVSKVMAERISLKQYRNAQRAFKGALLYAVIMGGAVALFCLLGASIMVPEEMKNARLALQMLSPTIFLSGILGVFRGYFQANRNMMPTSISQILEQVMNASVALLMAQVMMNHFGSKGEAAKWGAAGATMGTGAGVLTALLFMLLVYGLNYRTIRRRMNRDRTAVQESYSHILKVIVLIVSPIILSSFIYNVNGYINSYMYSSVMGWKGMDSKTIAALYAQMGYFMTLINIPLTLASTAPTSMIPEVSGYYARDDIEGAKEKIHQAAWISMLISIPAAVGLAVLAYPITSLLFPTSTKVAGYLLSLGAVTVILNGNSNISNGVLQGIGQPKVPMINAAIALAADIIVLGIMLTLTDLGIYAVVLAMIIYAVIMCILNDRAMKKYLGYRNPWRKAYLPPLLASIPMGIVAWGVYYGLYALLKSNLICLAAAICLGGAVYLLCYLYFANPQEAQLARIPGGRILIKFSRKIGR